MGIICVYCRFNVFREAITIDLYFAASRPNELEGNFWGSTISRQIRLIEHISHISGIFSRHAGPHQLIIALQ